MNRELKFQAWHKKLHKIIEVKDINIFDGYVNTESEENPASFEDIELMQFTGLKDKNGKEIYEGDILKSIREGYEEDEEIIQIPTEMIFNCGDCYWVYGWQVPESGDGYGTLEIIGNVYKNPDLLDKNK